MGIGPSLLLSSLIFAFVHPPFSFGPVFLLGLATAWLFHRTRVLLPSVLLHIAYNLLVLSRLHSTCAPQGGAFHYPPVEL